MATPHRNSNPFAMMVNPQAVLAALEHSQRLEGLQRRVCRPLDRPLIAKVDGSDLSAFDHEIDESVDLPDGEGERSAS